MCVYPFGFHLLTPRIVVTFIWMNTLWCYRLTEEKIERVALEKLITQWEKKLAKHVSRQIYKNVSKTRNQRENNDWLKSWKIVYFLIKSQVVRWESQLWWHMLQNRYCKKTLSLHTKINSLKRPIGEVNDVFTLVRKILLGQSKPTGLREFRAKFPAFFRCFIRPCLQCPRFAGRLEVVPR